MSFLLASFECLRKDFPLTVIEIKTLPITVIGAQDE